MIYLTRVGVLENMALHDRPYIATVLPTTYPSSLLLLHPQQVTISGERGLLEETNPSSTGSVVGSAVC